MVTMEPSKSKRKGKKTYYDLLTNSICVFCKNKDVNYLDENFMYYTSKTCGDQVCKSCYNNPRVFAKREVECPGCGSRLKKSSLVDKPKDQLEYNREREIRSNVLREFNLTEDEFDTEEDYRKYYELAESIIYSQFNRIDLQWADQKMEENRRQNRLAIARNASRRAQDIKRLQEQVAKEREEHLQEMRKVEREEAQLRRDKALEKEERIRVRLGELEETTAEIKAKKRKAEEEEEKKKQLKQGYGNPAQAMLPSASAQAAARMEALQPKPLPDSNADIASLSLSERKKNQIIAGGYDTTEIARRTEDLMRSCLLGRI